VFVCTLVFCSLQRHYAKCSSAASIGKANGIKVIRGTARTSHFWRGRSSAGTSHDRLARCCRTRRRPVKARAARPAPPACGLDRPAAARLLGCHVVTASRERDRSVATHEVAA
jgi:hypothetical protein